MIVDASVVADEMMVTSDEEVGEDRLTEESVGNNVSIVEGDIEFASRRIEDKEGLNDDRLIVAPSVVADDMMVTFDEEAGGDRLTEKSVGNNVLIVEGDIGVES